MGWFPKEVSVQKHLDQFKFQKAWMLRRFKICVKCQKHEIILKDDILLSKHESNLFKKFILSKIF